MNEFGLPPGHGRCHAKLLNKPRAVSQYNHIREEAVHASDFQEPRCLPIGNSLAHTGPTIEVYFLIAYLFLSDA
jgi:hypothetical protein